MKLFVHEHVTGGGMLGEAIPASLLREADLMLRTLLRELREVPGLTLRTTRDPRRPPLNGCEVLHPEPGEDPAHLYARGLVGADAAWPTAPESAHQLERLGHLTLAAGVRLVGCRPEAVHLTRHKYHTARALAEAGVPVVATYRAGESLPPHAGPWVVKPKDGAGALDTVRVPDAAAAARALAGEPRRLVAQPWIEGEPASLSLLCREGQVELLACNRQHVVVEAGAIRLVGLEVGAFPDADGTLAALARRVVAAIPGLDGYIGIDLLRTADGPLVLEVNPRLTTSYVALGEVLGVNIARRILHGADGPLPRAAGARSVTLTLGGPDA